MDPIDGPAAVLNQDSTVNASQNPADAGLIVQLFATALGDITVDLTPGESNPTGRTVQTLNPVTVRIAGTSATVEFAAGAPGSIGGVFQINLRIPAKLRTGSHPIEIDLAEQTTAAKQTAAIFVQ